MSSSTPCYWTLAALAQRLDKPLTARLMPIPGRLAGEPTGFDFAFFANSRIMSLDVQPLNGLFAGQETFAFAPARQSGLSAGWLRAFDEVDR